ncbi:MAG TPA: MAPEG family protein [Rhodoferax sp.]|nr:MAPEG family protein [Rhodoferax sp.]
MTAVQALLGFAAWTLLLVTGVFLYRGLRFVTGTPINHWPRGAKPADDAPLVKRLEDAHANSLENLPIFAVIVLAAAALGKLDAIAALAPWVLYARVGQSMAHLSGVGVLQVLVRATFWSVQLALFFWMLAVLLA